MIIKIGNNEKQGHGPIKILYPGLVLNNGDTGIGSIGRIDHAQLPPGAFIAMHPHINDEILSYFRSGNVKHTDSEGFTEFITENRLMLMKAGKEFYHEERVMEDKGQIEGLQIFIRPEKKDLTPQVEFHELAEVHSFTNWRMIASPETDDGLLKLRSETWIFDRKLNTEKNISLPNLHSEKLTLLLYVFKGSISLNGSLEASKGESFLIKNETISIDSNEAELVLFVTNENAEIFKGGMYSGNQLN